MIERIDLNRVTTYPLASRKNKVALGPDFAAPTRPGMTVSELLASLTSSAAGICGG